MAVAVTLDTLPGGDLVIQGLADLGAGRETEPALLVACGAERLRAAGLRVPGTLPPDPDRRLYALLAERCGDDAHSRYNALRRQLVSFAAAAEHRAGRS